MNPIEENAYRLLHLVCQSKDKEMGNQELQEQCGLSTDNLYDAVEFLIEQDLIHDYPSVVQLTNRGKRICHEIKNHPVITRTERAISIINEQINSLSIVLEEATQSNNINLGRQLLDRWDDNTKKILSTNIHPDETAKFHDAFYVVVDVIDTLDVLNEAADSRRAFLLALRHELANQPHNILVDDNKEDSSINKEKQNSNIQEAKPSDPRKVFVVYGRNEKARKAIFAFLRALGLDPKEWSQWVSATGHGSPYTGEVLKKGLQEAQAFVVLMTPDDEARLREPLRGKNEELHEVNLTPQPRPNVIYEAGMAMGIAEERTILIELGKLRPISDIFGRHVVRIDNTPQKRKELAQRLESAGCPVDLHGNDWLDAGDFDAALEGL